ncbi:hypothetical protein CPC08DRAFT_483149 [Agrocybe pediades]|nr:hypothetical protein CPC08DRAFT_483149 [Agrocybe pediades]
MLSCPSCPAARASFKRAAPRLNNKLPIRLRRDLSTGQEAAKITARSSSRNASSSSTSQGDHSPTPEPLTLLHKATKLVHRVPSCYNKGVSGSTRSGEAPNILDTVLARIYDDLSATSERPVKVTVCELDQWSGSQDLVTALLSDPLSSNEAEISALRDRWINVDSSVHQIYFRHKSTSNIPPSAFASSSRYLTQFPVPLEICELRQDTSSTRPLLSLRRILEYSAVAEADITIILFNPLTTPLKTILETPVPTNGLVLLSSSTVRGNDLSNIIHHEQMSSPKSRLHLVTPSLLSVSPGKAVDAVRVIQSSPNSLSAIQRYQDGFVDSGVSQVTTALKEKLQAASQSVGPAIRRRNALFRLKDVINYSTAHIEDVRAELDKAFVDTSVLKERIEEMRAQVETSVLGNLPGDASSEHKHYDVEEAIKQAERDMRPVVDNLTWWKVIWRVDEISGIVASAVTRIWCRDLERKLILQTGRLAAMQNDVDKSALHLLSSHPLVSTALLHNTLLQSKASPRHQLKPESLTQPLLSRRNQIINYPTARLHINGQKVVLGTAGGVLTGVGIGWAGWLGWLVGNTEGLLGFLGMEAGTAIGIGMLSAVATIRWAIAKWEKSKLRWWQDWTRIGEGLDRDLKVCSLR